MPFNTELENLLIHQSNESKILPFGISPYLEDALSLLSNVPTNLDAQLLINNNFEDLALELPLQDQVIATTSWEDTFFSFTLNAPQVVFNDYSQFLVVNIAPIFHNMIETVLVVEPEIGMDESIGLHMQPYVSAYYLDTVLINMPLINTGSLYNIDKFYTVLELTDRHHATNFSESVVSCIVANNEEINNHHTIICALPLNDNHILTEYVNTIL